MSKPKVAFFDFTSCEGCQLSKLNLEDDLLAILDLVELVNFREAISDRRDDYEIAFVEGSISTPHCVERIHKIRRQAKILVALGACAHIGGVNAIRNRMSIDAVKGEVYGRDKYLFPSIKAQAVADVVKVDFFVPGCPWTTGSSRRSSPPSSPARNRTSRSTRCAWSARRARTSACTTTGPSAWAR